MMSIDITEMWYTIKRQYIKSAQFICAIEED